MYLDVYVMEGIDRQNRLFVCFVALRPKSTGMVMAERSGHLHVTAPFSSTSGTCTFACNWQQTFFGEENERRNYFMINLH